MMTTDKIVVVTDGSCIGNPGPAGWAYVTYSDIKASGFVGNNSTNNAAELMAVIEAIKAFPDVALEVRTDSEYVLNTISGAWKRGKNLELWTEFDKVSENRKITYVKVRGSHGKNDTDPFEQLHDTVDELAKAAAKAGRLPESEAKQVPLTDPKDAKIAELERQLAERDAAIKQLKAERDTAVTRANKAETDLAALRKLVRGIAAKYDNNF